VHAARGKNYVSLSADRVNPCTAPVHLHTMAPQRRRQQGMSVGVTHGDYQRQAVMLKEPDLTINA